MGGDSEPEVITTITSKGGGEEDFRRVSRAGCAMSCERRLQVGGAGQGCADKRAELLLLRRRRRAHLLADEKRLLSAILAIRHLQGLPQRLEEEGQIDSESLRQDSAISRRLRRENG